MIQVDHSNEHSDASMMYDNKFWYSILIIILYNNSHGGLGLLIHFKWVYMLRLGVLISFRCLGMLGWKWIRIWPKSDAIFTEFVNNYSGLSVLIGFRCLGMLKW